MYLHLCELPWSVMLMKSTRVTPSFVLEYSMRNSVCGIPYVEYSMWNTVFGIQYVEYSMWNAVRLIISIMLQVSLFHVYSHTCAWIGINGHSSTHKHTHIYIYISTFYLYLYILLVILLRIFFYISSLVYHLFKRRYVYK